jgi:uncharacterized protein (TIGR03086 family)
MPDPVADYETAAAGFAAVLAQCPSALDGASPCQDWTAQDVITHVLDGTAHFTASFGGTVPEIPDDADLPTRYAALKTALADAARTPGALDAMVPSPIGGDVPASVMLGIYTSDTLIHTWDLARAIGVEVELDADLLQRSWDGIIPIESMVRRPGVFGPAVEVPDDAPFQDRAMAFFGRQP